MLSRVLLPQPDGPMMDTTSPGCTAKLTSVTANTSPERPRAAKRLATPLKAMAGVLTRRPW
jgi:hypothetical protein